MDIGRFETLKGVTAVSAAEAPFSAAQLPDIRNEVIDDLALPDSVNPALEVYALHTTLGMQMPADPAERDPFRQARLLIQGELSRLRSAALYWVSPEMTRLCLAAAPGMPAFYPRPDDLPSPCGLIYFALPIGEYEPWDIIAYADGELREAPTRPSGGYQVCAATWGPWDNGGRWKGGGTWFTFYTSPGARAAAGLAASGLSEQEVQRLAARMPRLRIDNEAACPTSKADHPRGEPPLDEAVRDTGSTSWWMHLVLCAFRLMETARTAQVTEQAVPRATRKRAARARVQRPDRPVRLVDITAGGVRRELMPGASPAGRTYHVRWVVSGHWRNQWYSAAKLHRPRWIDSYVKGPASAPLKVSETVHVFRNGSEAGPR